MRPLLLSILGIDIYAYPFFLGLACGLGHQITIYLFEKKKKETKEFNFFFPQVLLWSWLGAKLGWLFFSSNEGLGQYLGSSHFWLGGGLVFYGGLLFSLLFIFIYSSILKKFNPKDLYYLLPGLAFGHAVGRIGCFFSGCCFGKVCNLPIAISLQGVLRHPVQLYEAMSLLILGVFFLFRINKERAKKEDLFLYLIFYSIIRFIIEFFRGDSIRGIHYLGVSTSQLIALGLIIFSFIFYKSFFREA